MSSVVKGIVSGVTSFVKNVVSTITNAIKTIVTKTIDTIARVGKMVVDVTTKIIKFTSDFASNLVKGVIEFIKTGDVLSIVLTIAAAVMTGGGSLVLQFGVPALTKTMYQHGIISEQFAMIINVGVQIYFMFSGGLSFGDGVNNLSGAFQAMGVSAETALWLANSVSTGLALIGAVMTLKAAYDAYKEAKALNDAYATALAQFEAWKKQLDSISNKIESSDAEIHSYADNSYYKNMPGQVMYAPFGPGKSMYVATDVATPAHWVDDRKAPYSEDDKIAKLMWENKFTNPMSEFDLQPYKFQNGTTYNTYASASNSSGSSSVGGIDVISVAIRNNKTGIREAEVEAMIASNNVILANNKASALDYLSQYYLTQEAIYKVQNSIDYLENERANLVTSYKTEVVNKLITTDTVYDYDSSKYYIAVENFNNRYAIEKGLVSSYYNEGRDAQYDKIIQLLYNVQDPTLFKQAEIANAYMSAGGFGTYTLSNKGSQRYKELRAIDGEAWDAVLDSSRQYKSLDDQLIANQNTLKGDLTSMQNILKTNFSNDNLKNALQFVTLAEAQKLFDIGGFDDISSTFNKIAGIGFTSKDSKYIAQDGKLVESGNLNYVGDLASAFGKPVYDSYWVNQEDKRTTAQYSAGVSYQRNDSVLYNNVTNMDTMSFDMATLFTAYGIAGTVSSAIDFSKYTNIASQYSDMYSIFGSRSSYYQ